MKRLPTEWKSIISSFQNLSVIISCDAIHDLGCYVRYPLEWSQFEENVKFVRDNANFTMFNLVASNLTVHSIDKAIKWMNQYSNHISLTVVDGDIWQHSAVPLKFREVYVQSLEKIVNFPISNWSSHKFRLNCKSLIEKYRSKEYDINLHKKLQQEITEQDSHRKSKLKTVDSFLDSWIYERI